MSVRRVSFVSAVFVLAFTVASCSDDDSTNTPQCKSGEVWDATAKKCVPSTTKTCDVSTAKSCKNEFSYCDGTTCQPCPTDNYNCDGINNCESKTKCGSTTSCSVTKKDECGNEFAYCDGAICQACPSGKRNCDGINDCESSTSCGGTETCSAATKDSCKTSASYCASGSCEDCPMGKYNCDGVNECESSTSCTGGQCDPAEYHDCVSPGSFCSGGTCQACGAGVYNCDGIDECETTIPASGGTCDPECTSFEDRSCVKNPNVAGCRCEECMTTADCLGNPRAQGNLCDTSDMAGTGFNFCICKTNADCTSSTTGKICKAAAGVPNPDLKQCTCDGDSDCPATHPICAGETFKKCVARCTKHEDCVWGGVEGTCDTETGKCTYPDW